MFKLEMTAPSVLFLCVALCLHLVFSATLFDYGNDVGDLRVPRTRGADEAQQVEFPVNFFRMPFETLYISPNGAILFDTPAEPQSRMIAPFFAGIDYSKHGSIWYRTTPTEEDMARVTEDIERYFPSREFSPTDVLIVTWDNVRIKLRLGTSKGITFQAVIITSHNYTLVEYLYDDNTFPKPRALTVSPVIGFSTSNVEYFDYVIAENTKSVFEKTKSSNVNERGVWVFQVDGVNPYEIVWGIPDGGNTQGDQNLLHDVDTDLRVSGEECSTCSDSATCQDYNGGSCCVCNERYMGNGKTCLRNDMSLRARGAIRGTINGEQLSGITFNAVIVAAVGLIYTDIGPTPQGLNYTLQLLLPVAETIGWLFARPERHGINGMTMTGGTFRSTSVMRFMSGEEFTIDQDYVTSGESIRTDITVSGELPVLEENTLIVTGHSESYIRQRPGVVYSFESRGLNVSDSSSIPFTHEQIIEYADCPADKPGNNRLLDAMTVRFRSVTAFHEQQYPYVRFTMRSTISPMSATPSGPCERNRCGENALCIPDGRSYYCHCAPEFEGDGLSCTAVDIVPYNVLITPRSLRLAEGDRAEFRCTAEGRPRPVIRWSRGRSEFGPDVTVEDGVLVIPVVTRRDQDEYFCEAYNGAGQSIITTILYVFVQIKPSVTVTPPYLEIDAGDIAIFYCGATGNPTPTRTWSKIEGALSSRTDTDSGRLTVHRAELADEGDYVCTGINSLGVDEGKARLVVRQAVDIVPYNVLITPRFLRLTEGDRAEFRCTAEGMPRPVIRWSRGRSDFGPDVMVEDGILVIPVVTRRDEDEYFCEAFNSAGHRTIRTILYVIASNRPSVTVTPPYLEIYEGDIASFYCGVTGYPSPTRTWSKVRGALSTRAVTDSGRLTFYRTELADEGEYECTGINDLGNDTGIVRLVVVQVYYVTSTPSTLGSPYSPEQYPHNLNNSCVLRTDEGRRLSLYFVEMSIERGFDFLRVGNGNVTGLNEIMLWSGQANNPYNLRVLSSGPSLWISFVTDFSVASTGFRITTRAVDQSAELDCGGNFKCSSSVCLSPLVVCDGVRNCANGADETIEACAGPCDCSYSSCIPRSALCDGYQHCPNNIDETDCPERVCGTRATDQVSPRIVGGVAAQPGEWPWQASIHRHDYEGHVCGGILLNRRWVLSASHCFELLGNRLSRNISNYKIVLGNYEQYTFNRRQQRSYSVERIINHPNYNSGSLINDITLIKLKSDVDYSNYILPACLPSKDWPAGTITWITGWGEQQVPSGTYDERLQEITVPTIDTATCNQPDWNRGAIAECCMFCAGLRGGGKDACQGDSGGPVVVENNAGKYEVIGIASWGYGCANDQRPGVYTKVFNYLDWIDSTMSADL